MYEAAMRKMITIIQNPRGGILTIYQLKDYMQFVITYILCAAKSINKSLPNKKKIGEIFPRNR